MRKYTVWALGLVAAVLFAVPAFAEGEIGTFVTGVTGSLSTNLGLVLTAMASVCALIIGARLAYRFVKSFTK